MIDKFFQEFYNVILIFEIIVNELLGIDDFRLDLIVKQIIFIIEDKSKKMFFFFFLKINNILLKYIDF